MATLPAARDQRFATTLSHGIDILRSFKVGEPVLSNREFVERAGLSKATVSRLTYTLAELGFLKYDNALRKYRLGSAALSVGYPLMASLGVRQIARPFMKALADHAGGSVSLGMRDRTNMVYIETSRGHGAIAFRPDIGASLPMLSTAIGRAWLAGCGEDTREAALTRFRASDPAAWRKYRADVEQALLDFGKRGFCIGRGHFQSDVHAVAAPMQQPIDGEILVFNCGVPAIRLSKTALERDLGPRLVAMVRQVEQALGAVE